MNADILIIGGGISGLHTAYELQKRGADFILLEARNRLGGRILSKNYSASLSKPSAQSSDENCEYDPNSPAYDLGPSWFWPGQTNMDSLISELNLMDSVFYQQASGESLYEDQQGNIQKGFFGISMEGTYRMNGGIRQIISKLEEHIYPNVIIKSAPVKSLQYKDNRFIASVHAKRNSADKNVEIVSKRVVIALPPRVAMSSIDFKPSLPESRVTELNSYATWMAGHAKILIIYDKPFWREQGLSGDAVSHLGPMREIHDASSPNIKNRYAFFGFVGIPASYRKGNQNEICKAAVDQLVRIFGEAAANPIDIILQDWAQEKFTATEIDQSMDGGHASSSIYEYNEPGFDDCLIWSGTETADYRRGYNGLLEGALEASIRTLKILDTS